MKRKFCLALLFCLVFSILVTGLAGCREKDKDPEDPPIVGGYSQDRAVTPEDMEIFNQAMEGFTGVAYEPTLVATQVVAGMNYRFTATATPVIPEPESYTAYVYIFKPLNGPPELVDVEKASAPASEEDRSALYVGQWHAMNMVAAGFDERWLFGEDGAFLYASSDMDALNRLLFEAGQWKVTGSELQLTVESRVELVGGTVESSDEGDYIDGAEAREAIVDPPEHKILAIGEFGTDEETGRKTISIGEVTFYDFDNQDNLFDSYYEFTGISGD